jgi:predicted Ser/Thr protein kinase
VKCFKCGADVPPPARFCGHCGTLVGDPQAATLVLPSDGGDDLLQRLRLVLAGEYEVEQELARGGMAVVFKAIELGLRRVVALKVLPPELGLTAHAAERFKREARMVAEIDHPNIIPVYRVGQFGGILFIVMKFVEGKSLDAILQEQGALPVPVILYVLRAAARALAYAHACGIVHRDVKGANILVDSDGRVMVSDFGVALRSSDVTLTADGAVIGTPAFMSPEQCAGRRAGPQSDQYSLGIVAFQMLAGSVPFHADTLAGVMHHHFFTPVPDLGLVRDDVPRPLDDVVRRALHKDPERRFKTTREMLTAIEATALSESDRQKSERMLQDLVQGRAVQTIATRALPPLADMPTLAMAGPAAAAPPPRRRPAPLRFAGLTAAGVVAFGAVWLLGRPFRGNTTAAGARPDPAADRPAAVQPSRQPRGGGPAPRRAAPATGRLRLSTIPPDAEIVIDGRKVGIGLVFDLPISPGPRHLEVRAQGYATFDTTVVVEPGITLSLGRVTLRGRGAG